METQSQAAETVKESPKPQVQTQEQEQKAPNLQVNEPKVQPQVQKFATPKAITSLGDKNAYQEILDSRPEPVKDDGDEGIIILRAYSKKQLPCKLSPLQDITGKTYTGQGATGYYEDLTENDKKGMGYVITPRTVITVREGMALDTTKPGRHRDDWRWMRKHPYLAMRHEDGFSSRDARYYVYNEIKLSEEKLSRTENIDKAIYKIRFECSEAQRVKIADSLGFPEASKASPSVLMDWLRDEISSIGRENAGALTAITVLKLIEGGAEAKAYQKAMTMFHLLRRYRVIQTYRAGIWRWAGENGMVLGSSQERVVEFLSDKQNASTVIALEEELIKAKALSGDAVAEINEEDIIQPE